MGRIFQLKRLEIKSKNHHNQQEEKEDRQLNDSEISKSNLKISIKTPY